VFPPVKNSRRKLKIGSGSCALYPEAGEPCEDDPEAVEAPEALDALDPPGALDAPAAPDTLDAPDAPAVSAPANVWYGSNTRIVPWSAGLEAAAAAFSARGELDTTLDAGAGLAGGTIL
jgi:hypothetical protein